MEQVASAEAQAVAAMRTPISVFVATGVALAHAEQRTNLALDKLWKEYRHAEHAMPQTIHQVSA